jgi:hypothetical protein
MRVSAWSMEHGAEGMEHGDRKPETCEEFKAAMIRVK